jgi:hypothetical protein
MNFNSTVNGDYYFSELLNGYYLNSPSKLGDDELHNQGVKVNLKLNLNFLYL